MIAMDIFQMIPQMVNEELKWWWKSVGINWAIKRQYSTTRRSR